MRSMQRASNFFIRGDVDLPRKIAPQKPLELPAAPKLSRSAVIAVAIFLAAHLALLIGLATPEKFVFDEVHYVPAARQMLSPVTSQPVLNQMHYVQARIAMLDIFALGFGLLATAAFMHGFRRERPHALFALAGALFGLAAACKWSGLFPLGVCIVIVAVVRLMQSWHTLFADAKPSDWYRPDLWPDFRVHHVALCFAVLPALTYLAAFVPLDV